MYTDASSKAGRGGTNEVVDAGQLRGNQLERIMGVGAGVGNLVRHWRLKVSWFPHAHEQQCRGNAIQLRRGIGPLRQPRLRNVLKTARFVTRALWWRCALRLSVGEWLTPCPTAEKTRDPRPTCELREKCRKTAAAKCGDSVEGMMASDDEYSAWRSPFRAHSISAVDGKLPSGKLRRPPRPM